MATNLLQTGWSADGNWFWDGSKWNDAISADGRWKFDGKNWQAFAGQRTPRPGTATPPAAEPAPTWLAASEIERLQKEKADRDRTAAAAEAQQAQPLPKELDWRYAGQNLNRSQSGRRYADWQVGTTSIVIWALLYLFCAWGSQVFIFFTGWKTSNKILVAALSLVAPIALAFVLYAAGVLPSRSTP